MATTIKGNQECSECGGRRLRRAVAQGKACTRCGHVDPLRPRGWTRPRFQARPTTCVKCDGTGVVGTYRYPSTCQACKGQGVV